MKKLFAIVLITLLLLTSCGKKPAGEHEPARVCSEWANLHLNGEFYIVNQNLENRLYFIDFDTMTSAVVCSRPNCLHDDPEVCPSIGMDNHPMAIGNKLYFFYDDIVWNKDNKIVGITDIYCANLDGSGRRKIDTLENLSVRAIDYIAVSGSTVYFAGVDVGVKPDNTGSSGYDKFYMCSYDVDKKEFKNYGLICEGYSSSAIIRGEYDGGLYVSSAYTNEEIDFFADDWDAQLREKSIYEHWRLDLETGELEPSKLPAPQFVSGGFYGYYEDGNLVVLDSDGKSSVYEGVKLSGATTAIPINGIVFNEYELTALDVVNGEVLYLNPDVIPAGFTVLAYRDGAYIGSYEKDGTVNKEYLKIPEEEMFVSQPESGEDGEFSLENISWRTYCNHPDSIAMQKMSQAEIDEKMAADRQKYYEMLDPVLPERAQRYYELLGDPPAMEGNFGYSFCDEGYYLTKCFLDNIYFVGGVIDTDLAAECRVDVSITMLNPDTGEERETSETFINGEGECGLRFIVYPDEGFYVYKNSVKLNFTSYKDTNISGGDRSPELITGEIRHEEREILMLTGEWENLSEEEQAQWWFGWGE